MNLLTQPSGRPLIVAHRGASAYAPENTLAAFLLAVEQGADGVELDVKLSADGRLVVIHDQTVTRTTGAAGRVIEMTSTDLRRLDAGSHFNSRFAGERIPFLEEVFEAVGGRLLIDIEITNYASPRDDLADRVAALVRAGGWEDSVFFSSFMPHNLARLRSLLPSVPGGLLALPGAAGWLSRGWLGTSFSNGLILPHYSGVSAKYVARRQRAGQRVLTWTVNDAGAARRLLAAGVNGIITDDTPMVRSLLEVGEGGG